MNRQEPTPMAITTTAAPRRIDEMLTAARACLNRLTPREAHESARSGAVIVDIRPEPYRHMEGEITGAIFIERNVLEWRLDPTSYSRLPIVHYDLPIIVVCNERYGSSLAAAALKELGLYRATDLIGGFRAWRAAGLPTTCASATATTSGPCSTRLRDRDRRRYRRSTALTARACPALKPSPSEICAELRDLALGRVD